MAEDRYPWEVGQKVALFEWSTLRDEVPTIERLTDRMVILDNGRRFWRKDGLAVGEYPGHPRIQPQTQKDADKLEFSRLLTRVRNYPWKESDLPRLRQIKALMEEPTE